jgi:hypothetical protein
MTFPPLLKDPAIHFVIIGLLFWAFTAQEQPDSNARTLEISSHSQAEAWGTFKDRNQRDPTEAEWETVKEGLVREAILVHEARRLGLEKNDPIVRRRLVQKMEALTKLPDSREPTEAEIKRVYQTHIKRYESPMQLSLEHRFFSNDKRGVSTRSDAAMAVKQLQQGVPVSGDPFLHGNHFSLRPIQAYSRLFGEEFSSSIPEELNQWKLVNSSFGVHPVQVLSREQNTTIPLKRVREQVIQRWKTEQKERSDNPWIQEILSKYETSWADFKP